MVDERENSEVEDEELPRRYLIVVDIALHARWRHVGDLLRRYALPIQEAAFECEPRIWLGSDLRREIEVLLEPHHDSVRIYPLCPKCLRGVELLGDE